MKHVIITIHGVGYAAPGDNIYPMAQTFAVGHDGAGSHLYRRHDLVIGNRRYVALTEEVKGDPDDRAIELVEANWSEVQRPPRSIVGLVNYVFKLILGMWIFADQWGDGRKNSRLACVTAYRWFMQAVAVWLILQAQVVAGSAGIQGTEGKYFLGAAAFLSLGVAYAMTRAMKRPRHLSAWWQWFAAVAVIIAGMLAKWPVTQAGMIAASAWLYLFMQLGVMLFMAAAIGQIAVLVALRQLPFRAGMTRMFFCYVPFLLLSAFSSGAWLCVLGLVDQHNGGHPPDDWLVQFTNLLHYDLTIVEHWMTVITFLMIDLVVVGAIAYFVIRRRQRHMAQEAYKPFNAGAFVRVYVFTAAIIILCMLVIPAYHMVDGLFHSVASNQSGLLEIYAKSALRNLGLIVGILPQTVLLLDIVGDFTLYGVPQEYDKLTNSTEARDTLANVLRHYHDRDYHIALVAHSLGSVVATDVLGELEYIRPIVTLITAGSPLHTIHDVVLQHTIPPLAGLKRWINVYRRGDYIGGPIDGKKLEMKVENLCIGNGGHNGYWRDRTFLELVRSSCCND